MWISDPVRKKSLFKRMFSTHPPMDDRIARLNDLAVKMEIEKTPRQSDPFKRGKAGTY